MEKAYLLKSFEKVKEATKERLKEIYPKGSKVLIKIHFGEPGNKFAFTPEDVEPVVSAMKELDLEPVFIDTPVAYSSSRGTVKSYKEVVKERGYDKLAHFVISNNGVSVKTKDFEAQVCKELIEAENVLVLTHVKGHDCSGFGGAIKNLGMGGLTRETKSVEHDLGKPKFVGDCEGCEVCAELCPAGAIEMVDGKAKLNNNLCWGCSICQVQCSYNALAPKKALFDDLLAQGASAVINNLPQNTYYINVIKNITKYCDCAVNPGEVIGKDIGVLFSNNPVAIDKASIDLVREKEGREVFKEENHKDPMLQVNFTSRYTGKTGNYELEEIK